MSTRSGLPAVMATLALTGSALVASPALAAPRYSDRQDVNPPAGAGIHHTGSGNDGYGNGVIPSATSPLGMFNLPRMKSAVCLNTICV